MSVCISKFNIHWNLNEKKLFYFSVVLFDELKISSIRIAKPLKKNMVFGGYCENRDSIIYESNELLCALPKTTRSVFIRADKRVFNCYWKWIEWASEKKRPGKHNANPAEPSSQINKSVPFLSSPPRAHTQHKYNPFAIN